MPNFNIFRQRAWLSEALFDAMKAEFQQNGKSAIFDQFCKDEKIATFCKMVAQKRLYETHLQEDYEDIGADAYIKWQKQLPNSNYTAFTKAVLRKAIENYCIDQLRLKQPTKTELKDFSTGSLDALINDDAELERRIYQEKLLDQLQIALSKFKPNSKCKEILDWRYKDKLEFEQIGTLLGTSKDAIKTRIAGCKRQLKTFMGNIADL
jgi:RNA polymerase sigma factor (sigma-70 family)